MQKSVIKGDMTNEQQHRLDAGFRDHQSRLLGYVRSKMQSLQDAEDLVQDVYLQALHNLNALDAVDNLAGWLYTVTRNRVIDWYRRKKAPVVAIDQTNDDGYSLTDVIAESEAGTFDAETRAIFSEAIIESIEELPEKQRYVFIQQVVEGRTFRDLAEETGESINTLLARKRYAVQFLRGRLEDVKKILHE